VKYFRLTTVAVAATSVLTVAACGQNRGQVAATNAAAEMSGPALAEGAPLQESEVQGAGVVKAMDNRAVLIFIVAAYMLLRIVSSFLGPVTGA
jgi:hypothetical protein